MMVAPLIIIPFTTLIFINSINFVLNLGSKLSSFKIAGSDLANLAKLITLFSLFVNLLYGIVLWKEYPKVSVGGEVLYYPSNSFFELQHNLNLPLAILSTTILVVALLTTWYSSVNMQLFLSLVLLLEIFLVGAFGCTSIFIFLLFFEASAIPIFVLMVYCGSDRRERLKASYYFIFFTLYGSLALLLLVVNLYSLYQIDFGIKIVSNDYTLWLLLFTAFAVKIPLFPFHIWLPYAHVEASTATSIILAALMLKLGGYGVLKFMLPLFTGEVHLFFRPAAVLICVIGIVYGGVVAIRQIDLKRQIAFSSISHMSFATLGIFTFMDLGSKGAMYLMISHGLTSAALFYLVGVLSERHHTRSVMAYGGLLGVMPVFCFYLLVVSLANVGFPGTSGFVPELFVLVALLSMTGLLLLPTLLGMLLTTASSLVLLLRLMFGHVKTIYSQSNFSDVSRVEAYLLSIMCVWMVIFGFADIFM